MKRSGKSEPLKPQASADELVTLVEKGVGPFAVVDQEGNTLYINPGGARLIKKKAPKLVGEPFPYPLEDGPLRDVDAEIKVEPTQWDGQEQRLVLIKSLKQGQAAFHIEWRIESAEERAKEAEARIKELEAQLASGGSGAAAPNDELESQLQQALQAKNEAQARAEEIEQALSLAQQAAEEAAREVQQRAADTDLTHRVNELEEALGEAEIASQLREEEVSQRLAQLQQQLNEAVEAHQQADQKLTKSEERLASSDRRVDELESLLDAAEQRLEEAQAGVSLEAHEISTELRDALSQCRDLEEQLQNAEERAKDALERVHLAEEQAEVAEERAYEAEGLLEEAERRAEDAETTIEELEQALEDAASLNQMEGAEELERLSGEYEALQKESEVWRNKARQFEKLEAEYQKLQDESALTLAEEELEELKARAEMVVRLEAELEEMRAQVAESQQLQDELEELREVALEAEELRTPLDQEGGQDGAEMEATLQELTEAAARIQELEARVEELSESARRASELEVQLQELNEVAENADELALLVEELTEAAERSEELEVEVLQLREVADEATRLQSEFEKLESEASRAQQLEARVAELESQLESLDGADPEMAQRMADLEAELARAKRQLGKANELLADPEQLTKLERQAEAATRRATEAEERFHEAQSLLDEVKRASVARIEELTDELERARTQAHAAAPAEGAQVDPETERLAFQDSLTGLPNINIIQRYLDFMLKQAERYNRATALLAIDLDRFKMVNDALGHKIGDELLCLVAERLSTCVRGSDVLGRRGEDEFIILLSELSGQEEATSMAAAVARRVFEVLRPPFSVQDQKVHIGCCVGISLYPADAKSADQMLDHADTAIFQAKELGRGRYQFFTPELQARHDVVSRLDGEIRRGLEENQFQLFYQPVFNLMTGRMAGVESLVRWNHPSLGMIGPGEFLEAAEDTGQIVAIGRWAILHAIEQHQRWAQAGIHLFTSINISRRQLLQADLASSILRAIEVTGAQPGSIVLEFSENLSLMDSPRLRENLEELRQAGLKFAIDRFGTGSSSLEELNTEHITMLKIDRRFTLGVPDDHEATSVVLAALSLARNLKMTPVVVGIENKQQKQLLQRLECELGQGNFLSEPLSAQQVSQIAGNVFT